MNLFDIDEKYYSHPNYAYQKHIKNIADSFGDESHKQSAMFHDLGKLCDDFQTYINPEHSNRQKTTHAIIGALIYLSKQNYQLDKNSLPILISILKHHGNLEDVNAMADEFSDDEELLDCYSNLVEKFNEVAQIINLDKELEFEKCSEYFYSDDGFVEKNNLGGFDSYFRIKEVFSRLIFADKYEAIFKNKHQESRFENPDNYIAILEQHLLKKTNELSEVRNSARNDILEKFNQNIDKSIFIIEAPTGIGKTFTALHLALEIVKQKKKKRLITALPMTSIIDQTYIEYSKIFDDDLLLKYHHLTCAKSRNADEREEQNSEQEYFKQKDSYLTKSWAEDNVIITTFNQVLNLFYSNKNRDLIKFWTLRDSVIIMDEVQAIPRVLLKDFSKTISFLSKQFNIDFILMSATVPEIKNILDSDITIELLENKYFSKDFNNRYSLRFDKSIDSEEQFIDAIEKKFDEGKSVLSVVNTKKLALRIFERLQKVHSKHEVFLLSSYFIPKHRKNVIEDIAEKLKNREKVILISTQVVEAGVDLDFDCGFREFSPFYSIIQTAGRINRENRDEVINSANLTITSQITPFTPYHATDLLKEMVEELLSNDVRENKLLPLLKKYFKASIERTPQEMKLKPKMDNLEFQEVVKTFDANFMKEAPYITQLFIEIEEGLYEQFYTQFENLYEILKDNKIPLEKKMEIKIEIKEVYKQVSQFVINVSKDEVSNNESFYRDSEMKVCRYEDLGSCYTKTTGYFSAPEQPSNFF